MNPLLIIQRPIEFRAWHVPTQKMYYGAIFNNCDVYFEFDKNRDDNYTMFRREDCMLMQYTGILDCNGTKLWEGDVLYWSFIQGEDDDFPGEVADGYELVVFWHGSFGSFITPDPNWFNKLSDTASVKRGDDHEMAVIGNVFEQPELLKHVESELPKVTKATTKDLAMSPPARLLHDQTTYAHEPATEPIL